MWKSIFPLSGSEHKMSYTTSHCLANSHLSRLTAGLKLIIQLKVQSVQSTRPFCNPKLTENNLKPKAQGVLEQTFWHQLLTTWIIKSLQHHLLTLMRTGRFFKKLRKWDNTQPQAVQGDVPTGRCLQIVPLITTRGLLAMCLPRFKGGFKFLKLSINPDHNKLLVLNHLPSNKVNH